MTNQHAGRLDPLAPDPVALAALAEAAAREAGALLLAERDRVRAALPSMPNDIDLTASAQAMNPFTETDRACEELIARRILEVRPRDGFVAEEGTSRDGGPVQWIVDPIDGTANYLRGIPHFSVSIAADVSGTVVAGVVYSPLVDELFRAARGAGATLNGGAIRVSPEARLSHAVVATGLGNPGDANVVRQHLRRLHNVLPVIADVRRTGSAALDLCWVACGRVDAYYEAGQFPWDIAAGDLIVREAGGRSEAITRNVPLSEQTWLAANPVLFDPLRDLLTTSAPV
ncbi:MAG: inositol monophosphatase family protein [Dehalococcoidia bacterium]